MRFLIMAFQSFWFVLSSCFGIKFFHILLFTDWDQLQRACCKVQYALIIKCINNFYFNSKSNSFTLPNISNNNIPEQINGNEQSNNNNESPQKRPVSDTKAKTNRKQKQQLPVSAFFMPYLWHFEGKSWHCNFITL